MVIDWYHGLGKSVYLLPHVQSNITELYYPAANDHSFLQNTLSPNWCATCHDRHTWLDCRWVTLSWCHLLQSHWPSLVVKYCLLLEVQLPKLGQWVVIFCLLVCKQIPVAKGEPVQVDYYFCNVTITQMSKWTHGSTFKCTAFMWIFIVGLHGEMHTHHTYIWDLLLVFMASVLSVILLSVPTSHKTDFRGSFGLWASNED